MKIFSLFIAALLSFYCKGQAIVVDSLTQSQIDYQRGLQYKNETPANFKLAFEAFRKSAALGNIQAKYALGYMHYKGLGCTQDYHKAAELFSKGAFSGRDNSMYFYGLCWRNGYGLAKNEDSAQYWLNRSANLGYQQAILELRSLVGENAGNEAEMPFRQVRIDTIISEVSSARPPKIDTEGLIAAHANIGVIEGEYEGQVTFYDWSGQKEISRRKINLRLDRLGNEFTGKWEEEGADPIVLTATDKDAKLMFRKTQYNKIDHYSQERPVIYEFETADFLSVQKNDSIYLSGTVRMFSPERNEPSKPMFLTLSRSVRNSPSESEDRRLTRARVYPILSTKIFMWNLCWQKPGRLRCSYCL